MKLVCASATARKNDKMKKNSQVSFEFVLIFSLALIMIATFTYIINNRLTEISKEQELLVMKNMANNIKSEVLLAASVNNNYLRRFDVPATLNGRKYKMSIQDDALTIQTYDGEYMTNEYFTLFPTQVKGNFVDDINFNNSEHCITKNEFDGIRIARNQVSLDADKQIANRDEIIEVIVSLNCIRNIRSTQFTINYDPNALEILKDQSSSITYTEKELNPLFEDVDILNYDGLNIYTENDSFPYVDDTIGRYTFGVIGKNCATGSGNIARLYFKVIGDPQETKIEFDPVFADNNLIVLDCTTSKFTKEDIPDSKKGANIEIR